MNKTLEKFEYPRSLIKEYDHWVLLLRPKQVTIGSCVIAARCAADVTSLGDLSSAAGAELITVMGDFERALKTVFAPVRPVKFNYMALMMVDPNPHFHALPRFDQTVMYHETPYGDTAFPGVHDLKQVFELEPPQREALRDQLARLIGTG